MAIDPARGGAHGGWSGHGDLSPSDAEWNGPVHEMHGTMRELDEAECLELLASVPMGRVLISVGALPSAFPVNHHVVGRTVVFRSVAGAKLTAAVDGQIVGFEADAFEAATRSGWSVLVLGPATVVSEPEHLRRLARLELDTWYDHPALYVQIAADRISGRRVFPAMVSPGPPTPGTDTYESSSELPSDPRG